MKKFYQIYRKKQGTIFHKALFCRTPMGDYFWTQTSRQCSTAAILNQTDKGLDLKSLTKFKITAVFKSNIFITPDTRSVWSSKVISSYFSRKVKVIFDQKQFRS